MLATRRRSEDSCQSRRRLSHQADRRASWRRRSSWARRGTPNSRRSRPRSAGLRRQT